MMGFGRGWGMSGYGMHGLGGGIMMILFWALIILGIVYLVRNLSNNNNNGNNNSNYNRSNEDNAINIARERYAKGEISKEEYDRIVKDLK